ncbi:MAG: VWA domain-containing protein [Planctomycetaceae bacterium]|nr:VWA domain-containing protein [Planctomycetaceae bacterium]
MPLTCQYPQFFLLLIPLGLAFKKWGWTKDRITSGLRLTVALLLLLALTGLEINLGGDGLDVIVVVDRSRSMKVPHNDDIGDLIKSLEARRGQGDRVGIVAFDSTA